MTSSRHRGLVTRVATLGAAAFFFGACGGRTVSEGGAGGTTGQGSGGGSSVASTGGATTSSTSSTSTSSTSTSTSSTSTGSGAGGVSTGSGTGGGDVRDGSMCPIDCPPIGCPSGYVLVFDPGACCPVCKPDPMAACQQGRMAYEGFRKMLFEKYATVGCKTQMDCAIVYEANRCLSACGVALPAATIVDAEQNLKSFAESSCSACPPPVPAPCPPPSVTCIQNVCALGGPPPP